MAADLLGHVLVGAELLDRLESDRRRVVPFGAGGRADLNGHGRPPGHPRDALEEGVEQAPRGLRAHGGREAVGLRQQRVGVDALAVELVAVGRTQLSMISGVTSGWNCKPRLRPTT